MLVVHAFEDHGLFQAVDWNIQNLIPLRIQIWIKEVITSSAYTDSGARTIVDDLGAA